MPANPFRTRKWFGGASTDLGRSLMKRADAARDAGRWLAAAYLYEETGAVLPGRAGVHVQAGHMFKEAGMLPRAEDHYLIARRITPQDADLWLQLGHFYKVAGRLDDAHAAYRQALALQPAWSDAERELAALGRTWGGGVTPGASPVGMELIDPGISDDLLRFDSEAAALAAGNHGGTLAPALVPRTAEELLRSHHETIEVSRYGQREPSHWGVRHTVRGVSAFRGYIVSKTPVLEVQILLNGITVHRGPLEGGYTLKLEMEPEAKKKYVFNVWLDLSRFGPGLYALEMRFVDVHDAVRAWRDQVVIAPPLPETFSPDSDALVTIDAHDKRSVEDQIRARPSMVRTAQRTVFPDGVKTVLVLRTDQLGDMVSSIPAMERLRELLPEARIVGLLTGANAAFAATMPLFDEVIVVDFPDDPVEQRRVMPLAVQEKLRRRLAPYDFDIALDLASSSVSRDLLQLSGARFIYGVGGGDWPYLTGEFILNTRDRWTRMDVIPHSAKVLGMIEALGPILASKARVIPRDDIDRGWLTPYGIAADEEYVLLHAGARVIFSRWPHYAALARLLIERTRYKVVMMSEDAGVGETLPPDLLADDRFVFLDQRLPFDHFDAFISFAKAMVGNDSGPKHLASLRGTNVVTLFTARIHWAEWAQENVGKVISRRVPCAGCAIFHDSENCGKDFTCIKGIAVNEVYDALAEYL